MVRYEVNVRAFSNVGHFAGVKESLNKAITLGVNMNCLMPAFPIGSVNVVNQPNPFKSIKRSTRNSAPRQTPGRFNRFKISY